MSRTLSLPRYSHFRVAPIVPLIVAFAMACGGGGSTAPQDTSQFAPIGAGARVGREASARFEQLVAAGDPDPVGKVVAELQADPGVAQAQLLANSGAILVTMTSGVKFGMSVADKGRSEWIAIAPNPAPRAATNGPGRLTTRRSGGPIMTLAELERRMEREYAIVCDPANFPQSKKACVVNGFQTEFQQNMTSINTSLTQSGFTPTPYTLKTAADLVKLRNELGSCGVLYISSHGTLSNDLSVNNQGTHITTEIEIPSDPTARDQAVANLTGSLGADGKAAVGMTTHKGKSYFTLSPFFFAKADYPNTFVYADACNSADDNGGNAMTLKEIVEAKGAGGFFGWKGPISTKVSNPAADQIFDAMAPKVASNSTVTLSINPPAPGPGQAYVVSATISPAAAGVQMQLSVRGTDGFSRDETLTTNAAGQVNFAAIPGGASGVTDQVTVSAGGAQDSNAAVNAINNDPTLSTVYKLRWSPADGSLSQFDKFTKTNDFNLACNNANVVKTETIVKF